MTERETAYGRVLTKLNIAATALQEIEAGHCPNGCKTGCPHDIAALALNRIDHRHYPAKDTETVWR